MGTIYMYLLLVMIYFITTSEACTCVPEVLHPQKQICEADYVIRGRPTSVFHEPMPDSDIPLPVFPEELFNFQNYNYRRYTFEVLRDFKGSGLEDSTIVIRIPGGFSMCGFQLYNFNENPRDRQWLLAGKIENLEFVVELCNLHKPWHRVTEKQKQFLNNEVYLKNCQCPIIECVEGGDCDPTNECVHYEPDFNDCYINDLFCKRTGNGICSWKGRNNIECTKDNPFN